MNTITIPGQGEYKLEHLVLDFNGTIAYKGKIINGVRERLIEISQSMDIHVITADTNGTVTKECAGLPVTVKIIAADNQLQEKRSFVQELSGIGTVSMGNGVNDQMMFEASSLSIAILGKEGCAINTLLKSDIAVNDINDALDLLLHKNSLIATLRK